MNVAMQAVLSLFASRRMTDLVMDPCDIVPHTHEGYAVPRAIPRYPSASLSA